MIEIFDILFWVVFFIVADYAFSNPVVEEEEKDNQSLNNHNIEVLSSSLGRFSKESITVVVYSIGYQE